MKDSSAYAVKRLLRAISQNIDEHNIKALAMLINYYEPQLKQDIESISNVKITVKEL